MVTMEVFQKADNAISITEQALGEPPKKVEVQGHHWSYGVMVAAAVVGAITLVAAAILGQIPLAVAGGVLLVTGAIAAYHLRKFGLLKTLEEYVNELAFRITKLTEIWQGFKKENQELAHINEELAQQNQERKKIIEQTEKKLKKMAELYLNLKKVAISFTEDMIKFNSGQIQLDEGVSNFLEHIKRYDLSNDRLAEEVCELVDHVERFKQENDSYKAIAEQIEKQVHNLQISCEKIREDEMRKFEVKLQEFKKAFQKGAEKMKHTGDQYEEADRKLQKIMEDLKTLEAIPDLIEHLQLLEDQSKR